jgi:hypothetical protein
VIRLLVYNTLRRLDILACGRGCLGRQAALGVIGVPTFRVLELAANTGPAGTGGAAAESWGGELVWGQDRLHVVADMLAAAPARAGAHRRDADGRPTPADRPGGAGAPPAQQQQQLAGGAGGRSKL